MVYKFVFCFFKVYSKALFKSTDILTRIMQVPIKTLKQFRALIAGRGETPLGCSGKSIL